MKCNEMRIYFFLVCFLWVGSVYAQNQPVVLDEHNVVELNDAKEWDRFVKSWEVVPLDMNAQNALEIKSLAIYDDLVVVRGMRDQMENILLFDKKVLENDNGLFSKHDLIFLENSFDQNLKQQIMQ